MTPEDEVRALAKARRWAQTGAAKATREENRISLREMALLLDTSPSSLCRWENALARPRRSSALAWARLLEELSK